MVGLVVVSHSAALAEAACSLALEMVVGEPPRVVLAAGMEDGGFGTDAMKVSGAIEEANDGDGVVVLTDLGSAVLSAQMAVEFLPDPELPVRIVAAPFVEGLLAAVVAAAGGAGLDEVARLSEGALSPKQEQLGHDDASVAEASPAPPGDASSAQDALPGGVVEPSGLTAEGEGRTANESESETAPIEAGGGRAQARVVLVNPLGLHARPAAALAAAVAAFDAEVTVAIEGRSPAQAKSPLSVAGLGTRAGTEVLISASGPQDQAAVDEVVRLIATGFGGVEPGGTARLPSGDAAAARQSGIGVSAGRVVGPVARMPEPLAPPAPTTHSLAEGERPEEVRRAREAGASVVQGLKKRAAHATGDAAAILTATAALAADPAPFEEAESLILDTGERAEQALWASYTSIADRFAAAGGALAERASDVKDVRGRVIAALRGVEPPGVPERDAPYVLVASDLAPADTAGLDPQRVLAIVASEGGPTSHTAILARSLGLPAVVGDADAQDLRDGDVVLVDGSTAEVVLNPTAEQVAGARTAPAAQAASVFSGTASTSDGHAATLQANVGGADDARRAADMGARSVGLFRTEFAFLNRADAPSEDEQTELYASVLRSFAGGKVVVRTLDSGSDKPLPFAAGEPEENPALGVRGLRTSWVHPELLRTQLVALARAQALVPQTETWVMAPMVATADEARAFASDARGAGLRTVGVMIETPAAALMASALASEVDFFSLGTNDLAQYTMAADRLSAPLATLNDPWQPAVLRLIKAAVDGAALGRGADPAPVGVCGEAASDPQLACVLVGIGVSSLSMTPRALAGVERSLGQVSLETCRAAAAAALGARGAAEARAAAREVLQSPSE